MTEETVVSFIMLPAILFLALAALFLLSNSMEWAMTYCEHSKCGTLTSILLDLLYSVLQILAVPVSVLMVISSVLLLSILAVIQTIVWAFLVLLTNPIGIIALAVVCVLTMHNSY
ncbi:hypothetical protein ElyMa_007049600 [Elysia marginata]|uniref:G-protein coupled receptors family 1 profile domain-containing protein n=1 Tax=Elysia marginata TaxID=1093978 RepID=A0AAV4K0C8_9GAST|nr:hypothetical protein ElyMa_007049600 [Elysia marginata]